MADRSLRPAVAMAIVLAIAAVAGYLFPEEPAGVPKRIAIVNSGGPVVFEHDRHVKWEKTCTSCHHDMASGVIPPIACKRCHGVEPDETFRKTHEQEYSPEECVVCHHYLPGSADWGHKAHSEDFGVECTACHHKDTSIEDEPQDCTNCHDDGTPPKSWKIEEGDCPSFADAAHARCETCHEDWFRNDPARKCGKCHFDKAPAGIPEGKRLHEDAVFKDCVRCHLQGLEKLIPSRMDAQHSLCFSCHERAGKGPTHADCAQCHTK